MKMRRKAFKKTIYSPQGDGKYITYAAYKKITKFARSKSIKKKQSKDLPKFLKRTVKPEMRKFVTKELKKGRRKFILNIGITKNKKGQRRRGGISTGRLKISSLKEFDNLWGVMIEENFIEFLEGYLKRDLLRSVTINTVDMEADVLKKGKSKRGIPKSRVTRNRKARKAVKKVSSASHASRRSKRRRKR